MQGGVGWEEGLGVSLLGAKRPSGSCRTARLQVSSERSARIARRQGRLPAGTALSRTIRC